MKIKTIAAAIAALSVFVACEKTEDDNRFENIEYY